MSNERPGRCRARASESPERAVGPGWHGGVAWQELRLLSSLLSGLFALPPLLLLLALFSLSVRVRPFSPPPSTSTWARSYSLPAPPPWLVSVLLLQWQPGWSPAPALAGADEWRCRLEVTGLTGERALRADCNHLAGRLHTWVDGLGTRSRRPGRAATTPATRTTQRLLARMYTTAGREKGKRFMSRLRIPIG